MLFLFKWKKIYIYSNKNLKYLKNKGGCMCPSRHKKSNYIVSTSQKKKKKFLTLNKNKDKDKQKWKGLCVRTLRAATGLRCLHSCSANRPGHLIWTPPAAVAELCFRHICALSSDDIGWISCVGLTLDLALHLAFV